MTWDQEQMAAEARGRAEEQKSGIVKMISSLREFDICDADIKQKVMEKYNLDPKAAETYMAM